MWQGRRDFFPQSPDPAKCGSMVRAGAPSGSTVSHSIPPAMTTAALTRKEIAHPNRLAIAGVRDAVMAPPNWHPIFITPESDPALSLPRSALTDQKELCAT